jgi:hypothetical protein
MAWYHAGYYTGKFSRHLGDAEEAAAAEEQEEQR